MDAAEVLGRAASAGTLLLATDFDGTISEIALTPGAAAPLPGVVDALSRLRAAHGVHVAVVSGRPHADLVELTAAIGPIWRVAEHGSVIEGPRMAPVTEVARAHTALISTLLETARAVCAQHAGMEVEAKAAGVAMHTRGVPEAGRAAALAACEDWAVRARALGARVLRGRQVVEAHASDRTKASALAVVIEATRPHLVVYAGDDETDEGAILLTRKRGGIGVYIASDERPTSSSEPSLVLPDPRAWVAIVASLAARRATAAAP